MPFAVGSVKYIQVAGTNGKGSTSHFIAAILRSAGWRVGLFTSPHLQDVRERIRFNGRMISRRDFAAAISAVDDICRELLRRQVIANQPTFFETVFLAALYHFSKSRADWAVLEVGLGGRLDATSTIIPEVAVITNIARDHTHILGKTLAAIAREKAGICKENVPLVSGCRHASIAGRVIAQAARDKKAPFHEVFRGRRPLQVEKKGRSYLCHYRSGSRQYDFRVYLKGRHQTVNAAVAVKTMDVLKGLGWNIPEPAIRRGIKNMFIPARIEFLGGRPPVILDGGHNPDGIRVLVDFLREENISGFYPDLRRFGRQALSGHGQAAGAAGRECHPDRPAGRQGFGAGKIAAFFQESELPGRNEFFQGPGHCKKIKKNYNHMRFSVSGRRDENRGMRREKIWTSKS